MPSLMPGMPGAKEVYGMVTVREDGSIRLPPRALERYGYRSEDQAFLVTGHRGKPGFGLVRRETGERSAFSRHVEGIEGMDTVKWTDGKAYSMVEVKEGRFRLSPQLLEAYHLEVGLELLVIKSTTVAMGFAPAEEWRENMERRGLLEAVENMERLPRF